MLSAQNSLFRYPNRPGSSPNDQLGENGPLGGGGPVSNYLLLLLSFMLFRVPEYYVVILRCHEFTMQDKLDGHHKSALLLVALGLVMIGKKVWNRLESVCKPKRPQLAA